MPLFSKYPATSINSYFHKMTLYTYSTNITFNRLYPITIQNQVIGFIWIVFNRTIQVIVSKSQHIDIQSTYTYKCVFLKQFLHTIIFLLIFIILEWYNWWIIKCQKTISLKLSWQIIKLGKSNCSLYLWYFVNVYRCKWLRRVNSQWSQSLATTTLLFSTPASSKLGNILPSVA